jgi:hypothetical protein
MKIRRELILAKSNYLIADLVALAQDLETLKAQQPHDTMQPSLAEVTPDKYNDPVATYVSWTTTQEKMLKHSLAVN